MEGLVEPVFQASPNPNWISGTCSNPASSPYTSKSMKEREKKAEVVTDTQTSMPSGIPEGAMCVQRFDDSLNSAIHITYRISLRSSSMREPRDPLLKVVFEFYTQLK
jgi:hypothetical protein